jgi:hypothetical protein
MTDSAPTPNDHPTPPESRADLPSEPLPSDSAPSDTPSPDSLPTDATLNTVTDLTPIAAPLLSEPPLPSAADPSYSQPTEPPINDAPLSDSPIPGFPAPPARPQLTPASEVLSTQHSPLSTPPTAPALRGRRYGFPCPYCSSRLEATESMASQAGTCPTCGNSILIPYLDSRGRLIDPTTHQIIKPDPHPVHAYAAAGHRAPTIIDKDGQPMIECPRCKTPSPIAANNCRQCHLPFTMEGTAADAASFGDGWAVASLVLGLIGVLLICFPIPAILAICFGIVAIRRSNQNTGGQGRRTMAWIGIALGCIGVVICGLFYLFVIFRV